VAGTSTSARSPKPRRRTARSIVACRSAADDHPHRRRALQPVEADVPAKRHAPRMGERLVDDVERTLAAQTVTVPAEETAGRVIAELTTELDRPAGRRD
jgi:hypothetical protein